jgi:hypothetical protein
MLSIVDNIDKRYATVNAAPAPAGVSRGGCGAAEQAGVAAAGASVQVDDARLDEPAVSDLQDAERAVRLSPLVRR